MEPPYWKKSSQAGNHVGKNILPRRYNGCCYTVTSEPIHEDDVCRLGLTFNATVQRAHKAIHDFCNMKYIDTFGCDEC